MNSFDAQSVDLMTRNFVKAVHWLKSEGYIKYDKDIVEDLKWDKSNFSATMALKKKLPLQKFIDFNKSYLFDNISENDFDPNRDYRGFRNQKEILGFRRFFKIFGYLLGDIIDPDPIRERIKIVIKELQKKYVLKEIYSQLGETGVNASEVFVGMKDPKPFIESLKNVFNANPNFIIYNQQPIFLGEESETHHKSNGLTPNESFLIPFISSKNRLIYAESPDKHLFVSRLEKYSISPNVNRHGLEWLYFEVDADDMEPELQSKDWVLASKVYEEDWGQIREFYSHIVVTDSQVLLKRLYVMDDRHFVLASDNEEVYPQQPIALDVIKEIWFIRRQIRTAKSKIIKKKF